VTSTTLIEPQSQQELDDDEHTRRVSPPSGEAGDDPADDLGLDRPLFPRRPDGDTAEEIDVARYDQLVAATRTERPTVELRPLPRPASAAIASVSPQAVFEITPAGGGSDLEPPEEEETAAWRPRVATGPGAAFDPTGPTPLIIDPPPRYDAAITTSPVAVCGPPPRQRPWVLFLCASAIIGVGAGLGAAALLLHRSSAPSVPSGRGALNRERAAVSPLAASRGELQRQRRPAPVAPLDVSRLLARARSLAEADQHQAAHDAYAEVVARAPRHLEALVGRASAAVELGRSEALDALQSMWLAPHRAAMLRVRLSMVRGEWRRAEKRLLRLPRYLRYQPPQMLWMAEIWRAISRFDEARRIYRHVLHDPRPTSARLRAQAHLALSELLLTRDRGQAVAEAIEARRLAAQQPSVELRARVERQLQRCQAL
jgi:hypothetical protein